MSLIDRLYITVPVAESCGFGLSLVIRASAFCAVSESTRLPVKYGSERKLLAKKIKQFRVTYINHPIFE
jgi:hypothetical protein